MENKEIVYISAHGEKYHKDKNCVCNMKSQIEIDLEEAKRQKKQPCKLCSIDDINNNFNNYNHYKYNNNRNWNSNKNKNKIKTNFINSIDADNIILNDMSESNINKIDDESDKISENTNDNNKNNINKDKIISHKREPSADTDFNGIDFNLEKLNNLSINDNMNNDSNFIFDNSNININSIIINNVNNKKKENIFSNKNYKNNNKGINSSNSVQNLIQRDIEKDKCKRYNYYKKYNFSQIENEKSMNNRKKNIENKILYDEDNKNNDKSYFNNNSNRNNDYDNIFNLFSSYTSNSLYLSNMQYLFNYFNYINNNNHINSKKDEMDLLDETYKNAQFLLIQDSSLSNGGLNNNSKSKDNIMDNESSQKGCYMYKLEVNEIKDSNEDNDILGKISIGFELEYINASDMNLIVDENMINKENKNIKIGAICENDEIKKNLIIFKNSGIIYILININKGKMFIVNKDHLEKRENNEIFYVKNFNPINIYFLKSIRPILHCSNNIFNNLEIKINDKLIKNNS